MKKLSFTLLLALASIFTFGQADWCATMEVLNEYHQQNPDKLTEFQMNLLNAVTKPQVKQQKGHIVYTIPLVVHVVHFNGQGNISKNQILDGIRILNEDFQKLNADTTAVRSIFKPYIADFGIEFKLAKIDPNGNPTEGITRHISHFTFPQSNRNSVKSIIQWDPFSYLNIWIVNQIGNNVLGFAQFPAPSAGSNNTYGIVCNADEWGSIELAQSTDGRTVTHEVGHCLNLLHTFQGSCGSSCHASGDFVCDTPPQFDDNNNSCAFSLNTCTNDASGGVGSNPNPYTSNVPDQLENYMGYGITCLGMFTEGQKARVYASINTYSKLDSITTAYNNIQTGTNPGYNGPDPAPIVEIYDFDRFTCAGGSITFNQDCYGGPISSYIWTFPGGTPSTSNLANPTVTYATKGDYDVSLKIIGPGGSDSLTLTDYVHVGGTNAEYSAYGYNETFELSNGFNNEWIVIDNYLSPTFQYCTFAAASGSKSVWIENSTSIYNGSTDQLISPSLKMSDVLNPSISMDVAYRRKNSSNNDEIKIYASLDCGSTWSNIITMSPNFFAFDNNTQSTPFFPSNSSQWKTVTIPSQFISSGIKTGNNVRFRIEVVKGGGNNIFIDNFRINGQALSIGEQAIAQNDLIVYPNPAKDQVRLKLELVNKVEKAEIFVQNILGERVVDVFAGTLNAEKYEFNLNASSLPSGIYFVSMILDGERTTEKLVVH